MVVKAPVSSIDKLVVPLDWSANKVLVAALVSLITTADVGVPWLVMEK